MKNTKKTFLTITIFFIALILTGRKFIINVIATEPPICGDINARIDEDIHCRIEVSNPYFEQLNSAHLNINIPNDVTFAVMDNAWTCTTTVNNISCDRTYSVSFPKNTFDYVDVVFGANKVGKYNIDSTVSGIGTNTIDISYDDDLDIPYNVMWCGDGECNGPEDVESCAEDCGECGDGECDWAGGEDPYSCYDDCGECGDYECNGPEDADSCYNDCGECGDGECTWGEEDPESCYDDCGECGDGECTWGEEDPESCYDDCGECGDGECNGPEDPESCPMDCEGGGDCGDGWCDWEGGEDTESCPEDCFPS